MNNRFTYADETDKCYGLTGMIISLNVLDSDEMLASVSLDDEDEAIKFTPDFFFSGNPRFSAKIAWNEMIKQYQMLTAMVVGNVLCRYSVHKRQQLTSDMVADLHHLIEDEGRDQCSLEDDEIDMIFDKTFNYLAGIYRNRQVHTIAAGLVDLIQRRRTLTGDEITDELQLLRRNA